MASQPRTNGFADLGIDLGSPEAVHRELIEAPMAAARQAVLTTAVEVAALLTSLPEAFANSQRRELERIQKSGGERDPRVTALRASIEQAEILRVTAQRGQARVERTVEVAMSGGNVFYGFVSDGDLVPLAGLTVRLTGTGTAAGKTSTTKTEADGSFSIDLGANGSRAPEGREKAASPTSDTTSDRMADMFAGSSAEAAAGAEKDRDQQGGRVDILRGDAVLYTDPAPVALDDGSVYREYVIADRAPPPSGGGVRPEPSAPPSAPPGASAEPKRGGAAKQPKGGK